MKTNKAIKLLKIIGLTILSIIGLVLLYLISSIVLSIIPTATKTENNPIVEIFIRTNGVHSDVVLPVQFDTIDWSKQVRYADTKGKDTTMKFVAFGWGDKGFYLNTPTWSDLKFSTAFNAAFGRGGTAMHVTFYRTIALDSTSIRLKISLRQYLLLVKYIQDSFKTNNSGQFIQIKTDAVYGQDDAFYEAKGSYSLFKTCNTWTNKALKACQQKACLWTPFDKGIFYHYK